MGYDGGMSFDVPTTLAITELCAGLFGRDNGVQIDMTSAIGQKLMTPIVGPTGTLAHRLLLTEFLDSDCHLGDLAGLLGVTGVNGTITRAIHRLCMFGFAQLDHNQLGVVRHAGLRAKELARLHPVLVDHYLAAAQAA